MTQFTNTMNKNILVLICLSFLIVGCGGGGASATDEQPTQVAEEQTFFDMNETAIRIPEQVTLCDNNTESIFCTTPLAISDIQPTKEYAIKVINDMSLNFTYSVDKEWQYNDTVYEALTGDCEDLASTMAKHMIEDGVDPKYLCLVYLKTSETTSHIFLAVQTSDAGILHLDYKDSGYPIEPNINFHMKMDNTGVDKWVKGNIPL